MKKVIGFSTLIIIIDQLLKHIITNHIGLYTHVKVINNFFYIASVRNQGAAWSILSGNRWLLIFVGVSALLFIYLFCLKDKNISKLNIITYSLLIGGIIGNLIDRIIYGYVIDYIELIFGKYHYPIFNLADICIVISVILIIIKSIQEEVCKRKTQTKESIVTSVKN